MNLTQILSGLNGLSLEELRAVGNAVNAHMRARMTERVLAFHVGQKVQFTAKLGQVVVGLVEKINRSTVTVRAQSSPDSPNGFVGMRWKVSPSFLTEVKS